MNLFNLINNFICSFPVHRIKKIIISFAHKKNYQAQKKSDDVELDVAFTCAAGVVTFGDKQQVILPERVS